MKKKYKTEICDQIFNILYKYLLNLYVNTLYVLYTRYNL